MSNPSKKAEVWPAPATMPATPEVPAGSSLPAQKGEAAGKATKETVAVPAPKKVPEIGGPSGPEPTRYGDWERKGRCIDF